MIEQGTLLNYVGGHWERADVSERAPICNPATGSVIATAPLSDEADGGQGRRHGQSGLPEVAPGAARAIASSRSSS